MDINKFAELSASVKHIYSVTPDVYNSFKQCSGDLNLLHTSEKFAHEKGFPRVVMYGNILNAFVSHFVGMLLPIPDVMIQSQEISFHRPVFLGDEIELEASAYQVSEAVGAIVYKLRFRRLVTDGKPELVAKGQVQVGLLK